MNWFWRRAGLTSRRTIRASAALILAVAVSAVSLPAPAVAGASSLAAAAPAPAAGAAASAGQAAGGSLESAAAKAGQIGRKVAMSLIALGFAIASIVLVFRRDFKEAASVFAVGLTAILLASPAGVNLLRDTVNSLFGS